MYVNLKGAQAQVLACIILVLVIFTGGLSAWAPVYASGEQHLVLVNATDMSAAILPPVLMRLNNATGIVESVPYEATLYNGSRITVAASPGSLYNRPYVGGYMTANGCQPNTYCPASEVKAAISFPGTNPSSIPSGNFLEGTVNLQGQDNYWNGRDYAVRAAHVLYPNGAHGVVADMWQTCEGAPYGLVPPGCGYNPGATELMALILVIYGLPASQVIYVRIQTTSTAINWLYSYDGNTWMQYKTFTPPSTFIRALYLGTRTILAGPYYTAFYYQFGVWAQTAFQATFNVKFQNPSYYRNGVWTAILTAQSIWGPHTFFDETWTYSSATWYYVNAAYPNPSPTVTFYWSGSTLPENVRLWG
jgi:hypothetical protein